MYTSVPVIPHLAVENWFAAKLWMTVLAVPFYWICYKKMFHMILPLHFMYKKKLGCVVQKQLPTPSTQTFALILETTTAADFSSAQGDAKVCQLGKGPVVSFMDRSTLYDRELYRLAFSLCEEAGIPCQTKTRIAGGNDSGAVHVSRNGVRTLAISAPCRNLHSPSYVANLSDIQHCATLTALLLQQAGSLVMITQMQNLTDAEHAILNQTWRGKKNSLIFTGIRI